MANPGKAYKPLPDYSDLLLEDVPAGWITRGSSRGSDPLDGQAHPDYKPHFPKGKCQLCGCDYERKSNRQQYCSECQPVASKQRKAARDARRGVTRVAVGVVPFRARTFVYETRKFIFELKFRYGTKYQWDPVTNAQKVVRSGFGSWLHGDWEAWKLGTFEDASGRSIPKGVEPERSQGGCDDCGGRLIVERARAADVGAKIGAKELVCSKCGLVHGRGIQSRPEKGVDDYRESGARQSW